MFAQPMQDPNAARASIVLATRKIVAFGHKVRGFQRAVILHLLRAVENATDRADAELIRKTEYAVLQETIFAEYSDDIRADYEATSKADRRALRQVWQECKDSGQEFPKDDAKLAELIARQEVLAARGNDVAPLIEAKFTPGAESIIDGFVSGGESIATVRARLAELKKAQTPEPAADAGTRAVEPAAENEPEPSGDMTTAEQKALHLFATAFTYAEKNGVLSVVGPEVAKRLADALALSAAA